MRQKIFRDCLREAMIQVGKQREAAVFSVKPLKRGQKRPRHKKYLKRKRSIISMMKMPPKDVWADLWHHHENWTIAAVSITRERCTYTLRCT